MARPAGVPCQFPHPETRALVGFTDAVRAYLEALRLTTTAIAEEFGFDSSTVRGWLRDEHVPSVDRQCAVVGWLHERFAESRRPKKRETLRMTEPEPAS